MTRPRRLDICAFVFAVLIASAVSACAQSGSKQRLLITGVQFNGASQSKDFDIGSINSAVTYALSAKPNLDVSALPQETDSSKWLGQDTARLVSIIQVADGTTLWFGDLTLPDQHNTERVGPVVIADGKGPRGDAPAVIADLVSLRLNKQLPQTNPTKIKMGCFTVKGLTYFTGALANVFATTTIQGFFAKALERQGITLTPVPLSSSECSGGKVGEFGEEAVLSADIDVEATLPIVVKGISITPNLSSRAFDAVPLPRLRSSDPDYLEQSREYEGLIGRAARAYLSCPTAVLSKAGKAQAKGDLTAANVGREILQASTCPLLAAALLEGAEPSSPEIALDIGRAYRQAKENQTAVRLLRRLIPTLQSSSDRARANYELGSAAFDLQQFSDALDAFKEAAEGSTDDFPDIHARYAQAAFLVEQKDLAEREIERALSENNNDATSQMLAARIALDNVVTSPADAKVGLLENAVLHTERAFEIAGDNTQGRSFTREIAKAALNLSSVAALLQGEKALSLPSSLDADAALMRARVRRGLANGGYESAVKEQEALEDYRVASRLGPQDGSGNPELEVVDLELAEATLFNDNFDEVETLVHHFLQSPHSAQSSAVRYEPVARLLSYAAKALNARRDLPDLREALLKDLDHYEKWPKLTVPLSSGGDNRPKEVPISIWKFTALDRFLCEHKAENPARDSILDVSRAIQLKLQNDAPPEVTLFSNCNSGR